MEASTLHVEVLFSLLICEMRRRRRRCDKPPHLLLVLVVLHLKRCPSAIDNSFTMTSEMQQLANDPNFVVQFAVGDPIPNLVPQSKDSGIKMGGVYFVTTKRYIMKKCQLSREDVSAMFLLTSHIACCGKRCSEC